MNKAFLIFFLLLSYGIHAQLNHVYNGNFELYDECPSGFSIPSNLQIKHCLGWRAPTVGTSDYFNECDSYDTVGVPHNIFGFQSAHNGAGYCGFIAYDHWNVTLSGWHEYLRGNIDPPLEAGISYKVSFYVNLSQQFTNYASSLIGAYISIDSIYRSDSKPFTYPPQIMNVANNFIVDTVDWTLISGFYTAIGGERYITVGWWGDSISFDTLRVQNSDHIRSYYYVDDVSIVDTIESYIEIPNVFTPNNDGVNDNWYPAFIYKIDQMQITIYNRWGEPVFEGTEKNYIWDGTCGNKPCTEGTYFYAIHAIGADDKKYLEKGFVQLLR